MKFDVKKMDFRDIATQLAQSGLSVLPCRRETKSPAIKTWSNLQSEIADAETIRQWYGNGRGADAVGIICGRVSGGVECLDFDLKGAAYPLWARRILDKNPELLKRLVIQRTQSGGYHVIYRIEGADVPGNQKLAQKRVVVDGPGEFSYKGEKALKAKKDGDEWVITPTLIETRGKHGYFLCDPSSGYEVIRGDLADIPTISLSDRALLLIETAKSFHEELKGPKPTKAKPKEPFKPANGELSPVDDFSLRGDPWPILERHGWEKTGRRGATSDGASTELVRRPGKKRGHSGTIWQGRDGWILTSYSTNADPLDGDGDGKHYYAGAIFAILECNGNFSEAARQLRNEGYGDRKTPDPPADRHPDPPETPATSADGGHAKPMQAGLQEPVESPEESSILDRLKIITAGTLIERPAPPEFNVECNGKGLIRKGIVGGIGATGGTGKTFFKLQMGTSMAGGASFHPFSPVGEPVVLFIGWEEDTEELSRRIWDITRGHIPERFNAVSALGVIPTMFKMDRGNNAIRNDGDGAIMEVIQSIKPDIVLLDPFAAFYGLEEKNDVHGNAYINRIRQIALETGATFLISHHTNEASDDNKNRMTKRMFRGVSALTDGYRWAAGMRKMQESTAKRYGIQDYRRYVEFDTVKANGGAELARPLYFRQNDETGILEHFDPEGHRGREIADALVDILETEAAEGRAFSRREIEKGLGGAKRVKEELAENFDRFKAVHDLPAAIDTAWHRGLLKLEQIMVKKKWKDILIPVTAEKSGFTAESLTAENSGKKTVSADMSNDNSHITAERQNSGKIKLSADMSNDFKNLTAEKNHPLKGGDCFFPQSIPPGESVPVAANEEADADMEAWEL